MPDTDEPPVFAGIPVRGCFAYRNACSGREAPDGTGFLLEREKTNPYDSNAIIVRDQDNRHMGHIGREYAAEIAPWMDKGWMFTATKTARKFCWIIIKLVPISKPRQAKKTSREHVEDMIRTVKIETERQVPEVVEE